MLKTLLANMQNQIKQVSILQTELAKPELHPQRAASASGYAGPPSRAAQRRDYLAQQALITTNWILETAPELLVSRQALERHRSASRQTMKRTKHTLSVDLEANTRNHSHESNKPRLRPATSAVTGKTKSEVLFAPLVPSSTQGELQHNVLNE